MYTFAYKQETKVYDMEAKSLMNLHEMPHQVNFLNDEQGDNIVNTAQNPIWTKCPIPLTPNVLKLNGFNLEMNDYVWTDGVHSSEQVYVAISFHRDGTLRRVDIHNIGCQFYCDGFSSAFVVSDFHRALCMCGFYELASTLKVE